MMNAQDSGNALADLAIARAEADYQRRRALAQQAISNKLAAHLGAIILGMCPHCGTHASGPHTGFCPTRDKEFGR